MVLSIIGFFQQLIERRGTKRCQKYKHKWIDMPHKTRRNVTESRCKYCGIVYWTLK